MGVWTIVEAAIACITAIDEAAVYALQSTGVLAHTTRRRVIAILIDQQVLPRERLATLLATDDAVSQDDGERLEIELHHDHLPRLEAELFVEYDRRSGAVTLWKDPETAAELLDAA